MTEKLLTEKEAYLAMVLFLENIQRSTNSDDIAELLGDLQLNEFDNKPMDIALWNDWINCLEEIKKK
ncbi:MAG: hypothetical protein ABI653_05645 [Bacteroidota bacterium]